MFRETLLLVQSLFTSSVSNNEKVTCYHCGEKSRKNLTVYVQFSGLIRPVCCQGCAAILKTVEELGIHDEYKQSKITVYHDKKQ